MPRFLSSQLTLFYKDKAFHFGVENYNKGISKDSSSLAGTLASTKQFKLRQSEDNLLEDHQFVL